MSRLAARAAVLALLPAIVAAAAPAAAQSFTVKLGDRTEERRAIVCAPKGRGPFPAVVFNHGSIVDGWGWPGAARRGYRLDRVCEALAREGYFVFAPIRELTPRGRAFQTYDDVYVDVVAQAVDHVKMRGEVDASRVALAGFSMGGLVSLRVAMARSDLRAVALLAPAAGHGLLAQTVPNAARVTAPVLVLIESSDAPHMLRGAAMIEEHLRASDKPVRLIQYDRGGGHELFYDVGYWWSDLTAFLAEHLAPR